MRTLHRTLSIALGLAAMFALAASVMEGRLGATPLSSTPVILSVTPASPSPGKDPQILRIGGQDFQARLKLVITTPGGNTIELKDDAIQQQQPSAFQVSALLAMAGKYSLVVTNPDGGISAPFVIEARAVAKPPTPVIQRVLPETITKGPEAQTLTVEGQNFGPGVHVVVTDPLGVEVLDPVVREVSTSAFKLSVKLETAGPYNMVVSNATGAVSNVAVITVK
jgi:hypothetical protein